MGTQLSPAKKEAQPQFSAHVCCGQTAGWIKIPLGMQVGLGPGDIVLDGDPPLHFSAHVLWPSAGWIKMPLGTEVDLGPGHIVSPPSPERGTLAPLFLAHVCCGQTVLVLSHHYLSVYIFVRYIELSLLSPRIMLLFLGTRVTLRGQKGPHVLT